MALVVEFAAGSVTEGTELVLVNASNTNAQLGAGVSGAVRRACGPQFQGQLLEALQAAFGGPMPPGEVLLTHAGAHRTAKWVAHVAVMDYRRGMGPQSYPTLETIERACQRLWPLLETIPGDEPLSVGMVALGAGTGDLGVANPTRIAAQSLAAHCARGPSRLARVRFYGFLAHEQLPMAKELVQVFPAVKDTLPAALRAQLGR